MPEFGNISQSQGVFQGVENASRPSTSHFMAWRSWESQNWWNQHVSGQGKGLEGVKTHDFIPRKWSDETLCESDQPVSPKSSVMRPKTSSEREKNAFGVRWVDYFRVRKGVRQAQRAQDAHAIQHHRVARPGSAKTRQTINDTITAAESTLSPKKSMSRSRTNTPAKLPFSCSSLCATVESPYLNDVYYGEQDCAFGPLEKANFVGKKSSFGRSETKLGGLKGSAGLRDSSRVVKKSEDSTQLQRPANVLEAFVGTPEIVNQFPSPRSSGDSLNMPGRKMTLTYQRPPTPSTRGSSRGKCSPTSKKPQRTFDGISRLKNDGDDTATCPGSGDGEFWVAMQDQRCWPPVQAETKSRPPSNDENIIGGLDTDYSVQPSMLHQMHSNSNTPLEEPVPQLQRFIMQPDLANFRSSSISPQEPKHISVDLLDRFPTVPISRTGSRASTTSTIRGNGRRSKKNPASRIPAKREMTAQKMGAPTAQSARHIHAQRLALSSIHVNAVTAPEISHIGIRRSVRPSIRNSSNIERRGSRRQSTEPVRPTNKRISSWENIFNNDEYWTTQRNRSMCESPIYRLREDETHRQHSRSPSPASSTTLTSKRDHSYPNMALKNPISDEDPFALESHWPLLPPAAEPEYPGAPNEENEDTLSKLATPVCFDMSNVLMALAKLQNQGVDISTLTAKTVENLARQQRVQDDIDSQEAKRKSVVQRTRRSSSINPNEVTRRYTYGSQGRRTSEQSMQGIYRHKRSV